MITYPCADWISSPLTTETTPFEVGPRLPSSGGYFTDVSRALQNIFSKCVHCIAKIVPVMRIWSWNLYVCQRHALSTRTKFQLEINVISGIVYFRKIILESPRNVSETIPWQFCFPLCAESLSLAGPNHINLGNETCPYANSVDKFCMKW